jgi:hypothetical protein
MLSARSTSRRSAYTDFGSHAIRAGWLSSAPVLAEPFRAH